MFNFLKPKKNMDANLLEKIKSELVKIIDYDNKNIIESGLISAIDIQNGNVKFVIETTKERAPNLETMRLEIISKIQNLKGVNEVRGLITAHSETVAEKKPIKPLPKMQSIRPQNIKRLIAVASGKGGVGKSTIAFNIALALARAGAKTGLLDADIYGPSIPTIFGKAGEKATALEGKFEPIEGFGIKTMSIGYVVENDRALIWRGPMLQKALSQLFLGTNWGELDFLIIDLPPGTGDVQLSLAQQAQLDGIIMVATPQEVALSDVRRGIDMFARAELPILGIIENMSMVLDENTGNRIDLYGAGGAQKTAQDLKINYLGAVDFYPSLRVAMDKGQLPPENSYPIFDKIIQNL